jgi:hypothetical protein
MRLEELVLRIPGEEFRVRFHEHLTVLSGIGMLERQALADSLLGALTGTAEDTVLTYTDRSGRPVQIVSNGGTPTCTYLDDNTAALPLVGTLAPTADALRSLLQVEAGDIGLTPPHSRDNESPELEEARATLAALTQELKAVLAHRQHQDQLRAEIAAIETQLRQAEDGAARREYAKVLADLERVRAESAALESGTAGAESDRHLLESASDARDIATRWKEAAARVATLKQLSGAERLDVDTVAQARWYPEQAPADLHSLIGAVDAAQRERDRLDGRVRDLAASRLPEPSDPRVVDLATVDQDELWEAHRLVAHTEEQLEREQIALGGLGMGAAPTLVVDNIEKAHLEFETAEASIERRRVPTIAAAAIGAVSSLLLATVGVAFGVVLLIVSAVGAAVSLGVPYRRRATAAKREAEALEAADAPTYLSFHLRRVDAAVTPRVRGRLDGAGVDRRAALARWNTLTRELDPDTAIELEAEVREYARALSDLGGAAGEIESLHTELTQTAEPAVAAARGALREALATYGLGEDAMAGDDPALIQRLVHQQVALGHVARAQDEVEEAEAIEEKLGNRLDDLLHQLGFRDGNLESRAGALEWAVERAAEREEARKHARPREAVEQSLVHLQEEARRLRRPEWASVQASEAVGPDLDELVARREELKQSMASDGAKVIDLERLSDRHSAMERRVAALEAQHDPGRAEATIGQLADVQQYLLSHLTKAAHAGPYDESVPVLLDEPFLRVPAERKWELLDMMRRLGEKTQLIYLTDDAFVSAWARRRAGAGLITLLEPMES